MTARLFCKTGALAGSEYHIGAEATIGRWDQNDITLSSDAVSGQHARIFYDDEAGCYVLDDLDSGNGTQLDDTEVVDPVPLKDLHIITFAQKIDFIFQAVAEEAVPSSAGEEKTEFGVAPESPSVLPGKDEPEGERTRIGHRAGAPPELPDEESTPEAEEKDTSEEEGRTQFGESPPELPDFSEGNEPEEDEAEAERTRMREAPGGLPDLPDEESTPETDEEDPSEEDRTQFGESPPELPDLSEEDAPEDERTRIGGMGEPPSELPPEEPEGDESDEEEHTQMGADAPALPDLPEGEPSSEEEAADEASPRYALQVILEGTPQGTHSLPEGEVLIGRSSDCDIQIEDPGVSRQHARLIVKPGEVVVEDVGSKNFTFVNGDRLSGTTRLSPGSEIQFGLQAKAILQRASS